MGLAKVVWSARSEIVAVATTKYQQFLAFEESDGPQILQVSLKGAVREEVDFKAQKSISDDFRAYGGLGFQYPNYHSISHSTKE
jgi:hypothetical protein